MKEIHNELCACLQTDFKVFNFLDSDKIGVLCKYFTAMTAKEGETLWNEGESCDCLALITSGRVEVKKQTEFKGKHVIVGLYNKGAIVGALCILDDAPRTVTAVALEDTTLAVISKENLEKLINEHPLMGARLLKGMLLSVSVRLRKSFERLAKFF